MTRTTLTRLGVLLVVGLIVLSGTALAQADERAGGLVSVDADEVVDGDLSAVGGTVVVAGTVNGDLEATAGTVLITGTVTGNVEAIAGSVVVEGTVNGDVSTAGGAVFLREGAVVDGAFEAAAGAVTLAGTVGGDARLAGEEVTLTDTAVVGGSLAYEAETFTTAPGASVAGTVTRTDDLGISVGPAFGAPGDVGVPTGFAVPSGLFTIWGLVVNLLLGGVLLLLAPRFAGRVTETGVGETLRSGGAGLLALVAVPLVLVALAISVVGIPLSLVGALLFGVLLWVATVYGALVAGTWGLSLVDREGRWWALLLGVAAFSLVSLVPFVGGVAQFVVLVVGLGAVVLAAYAEWGDGDRRTPTTERDAGIGPRA